MKKRETTAEFLRRIESDPERIARLAEQDQRRKEIIAKYRLAERPLILDLAKVGYQVESAWDLANINERDPSKVTKYEKAIPVLLAHLSRNYPPLVREGIALALGRAWARDLAWEPLLAAYLTEPNMPSVAPSGEIGAPSGPKGAIAIGLSNMAKSGDMNTLIRLISDTSNGPSRIFFVDNLSRSRSTKAFEVLSRLSNDPDLHKEIERRLKGKLRRQAKKAGKAAVSH